ncbi:DUF5829 family protein [Streptomyces sparsogenes]|uniref:DUF5829 family protein n=1 Tax=Streptomyces sparsogenes TaxID=67365 RepID=UPI003F4CCCBE
MFIRRVLRATVGLAVVASVAFAGSAQAGAQTARHAESRASADDQLLFYNHSYGVLDRETADAVENSQFLREFGAFEVRTTTGGDLTWKGRYLYGSQTYVELFGAGDLPGQDANFGSSAVAYSPEHEGDLAKVTEGLKERGVEKPDEFLQTRDFGDGVRVPWFNGVQIPITAYDAFGSWAMEYRPEYFADPRSKTGPASYPGDVSRQRYLPDTYKDRLMRDLTRVRFAVTERDLKQQLPLYEAGGLEIQHVKGGVLVKDGLTTVQFDVVPADKVGLKQITMALNKSVAYRHTERIGNSTLVVGPGARAVWTFDKP